METANKKYVKGANPYMPLWEHVPDGEPRVFEYQGEKRVYVYGSHDMLRNEYCGTDQVVWSAPVDDLTNWTCHGICYKATDGSVLFAPDVVQKGDTFYLYAAEAKGSRVMVAKSKNPAGPFTDPVKTDLGFDPGILVDDDGRVYAYWGFCKSFCAELNEDMATIKEGTFRENPLNHCDAPWSDANDTSHIDRANGFFEASSPRKINGKYVYLYSKRSNTHQPELGVYEDCNGFLSYAYSDSPLEGFKWGGDISFNGGEILLGPDGRGQMTYRWGNNHGGLVCIEGQWYIFYHRQTGTDEYSRQGMIEAVEIADGKDGALYIGKLVRNEAGEPVGSLPVEMTSSGARTGGIAADEIISAGYACHIYGSRAQAYIKAVYDETESVSAPIVGITGGTTVGFRYLNFSGLETRVEADFEVESDTVILLRVDKMDGEIIAEGKVSPANPTYVAELKHPLKGKHAVYFKFVNETDKTLVFDRFTFC